MTDMKPDEARPDPFHLPLCTCDNLRKTARAVTRAFEAALEPAGLTPTQFSLLSTLSLKGAMAVTPLAELLATDRTTLSRNLKPLLRRELVSGKPGADQRQRLVALTPQGQAALEAAIPLWRGAQERVVSGLGLDRWSGLIEDLAATVEAAAANTRP